MFFFFNDTATTEIYTLSLHDALPISPWHGEGESRVAAYFLAANRGKKSAAIDFSRPEGAALVRKLATEADIVRSEEHTSELQSRQYLVCRLLLEKKKKT